MMDQKVIRFLEDHRITFVNKKIIVAVSGGPDSVALLHFLKEQRAAWGTNVIAVTIDHQLREGAKADVQYVRTLCKKWDIRLISKAVNVRAYEERHKVSMQVAARELRYKVFANIMNEEQADYLALGHHGDDQIETLIMALMRTTNLSSLTGIPFRRSFHSGELIRPLLAVTKEEIERYCAEHQLQPRMDPSNKDITYTRNYVRQLVAPKLKEKNPSLHVTTQQLSETLQEDERYLRQQAQVIFEQIAERDEQHQKVSIIIERLRNYAKPLQRRVYRIILDYLYDTLPPQLSYSHEQIFLSLLTEDTSNKRLHFPQQLMVEVVYGKIELYFKEEKTTPFITSVHHVPEVIPLWDGNVLEITYTKDAASKRGKFEFIYPFSDITFPLYIRTRKPGDRMHYKGLHGTKKIKDILIDEKIPRQKRDHIPIITDAHHRILWLVGVRKRDVTKRSHKEALYVSFTYKTLEGDIHA